MYPIRPLQSFEQLKLIADPRRLAILRQLLMGSASLTMLGKALGKQPAWVRHHLKQLEAVDLVELIETRSKSGVMEKIYRIQASGFLVQEIICTENPAQPVIVFSGGHDLAVELLASQLSNYLNILSLPVGSLDGLVALRQNMCNVSGVDLLAPSGEYNLPFIRHFFPDRAMQVVTLAHREQGLMIAAGNPKNIRSLADLVRADVTFINRNPGSGTRLWLDHRLQALGIPAKSICNYDSVVCTHAECARSVQTGKTDAALGLRAVAHQFGLDFLPFFTDRYDLVFEQEQSDLLLPLLDTIQTSVFRQGIKTLIGYETTHTGEQIIL